MLRGFFSADTGAPTGSAEPPKTGTDPAKTEADEKRFTQAELDAIVKDRLDRRDRRAKEEAEKARTEAEAKALAEQGEFKTLAEQRQARISELEALTEQGKSVEKERDRYKTALTKQLEVQRADLAPHILTLLDKLDPADQLEWIAANRAALTKAGDGVGSPARGKPAGQTVEIRSPNIRI